MSQQTHKFSFTGRFGEVLLLIMKNTIFTILTLGLYIPYARTNMRKYIWKSTKLEGHPFLFHADPKKLLKGYLLLAGIAVFSFATVTLGSAAYPAFAPVFTLIPALLIWAFILRARFGSYAYLVNNTSYRSIRFQVDKSAVWEFMGSTLKGSFLTVLTLGIYGPFMMANLTRIKWQNTSFGNVPVKFEMKNSAYAFQVFKGIFFCVITFGIYIPWYAVSMHKFKMHHLSFQGAKVESSVTGLGLIWLGLKSMIFLAFSLGLATPYIMNMNLAYFLDNLSLEGEIDFNGIVQGNLKVGDDSFSESVADAFDMDVDVA